MLIDSNKIEQVIEDCYSDHEHYTKYRACIDETELKNSEATDKAVLTLSSASLALLLALSKDVSLVQAESYSTYLYLGWFTILSSMSCVLASMFISGVLHAKHRNRVDEILLNRAKIIEQLQRAVPFEGANTQTKEVEHKLEFKSEGKLSTLTRLLHGFAPILLLLGIFASGQFFFKHANKGNVYEQSRKTDSNPPSTTSTKAACQGGEKTVMSEQTKSNSVPPPSPTPKAPPPRPPANSK